MGRSPCCDKNGIKKGPWTEEEDLKLKQYIQIHGPCNWRTLPKNAGLQRCGKSCRLRWTNYLRPDIKRGRFAFEEEETIIQLHRHLGNKWSTIAAHLPGRTDNEIKNYWNTHIQKRLLKNGIDPVTHRPRLDLLRPCLDLLDVSSILKLARFNLSNLFNLQNVVNPQVLKLATLLASSSSNQENQDLFLNNHITPMNQNTYQEFPIFTSTSSTLPNTQLLNQRQLVQENNVQYFSKNFENLNTQNSQDTMVPNYGDQFMAQTSDNSSFQASDTENSIPNTQKFDYDSVLSSPLSSPTPLVSSSTFINSSSTEDERESYCSNIFKLEIPESFVLNDFM